MKTEEYLSLLWHSIVKAYPRPKTLGVTGNTKLGTIYNFSGLSIHTCPGKTGLCSKICYDAWGHKTFTNDGKNLRQAAWYSYLAETDPEALFDQLIDEIRMFGTEWIRAHVGGDFFNILMIEVWRRVAQHYRDKRFLAYTRSWRIPELLPALEALRIEPNVELFASVDSETGDPPAGWRAAPFEGTDFKTERKTVICPYETGKAKNCLSCGICFKDLGVNVLFPFHGSKGLKHKKMLARLRPGAIGG